MTTEYSTAYLMTYRAHVTPVNAIVWNTFYPSLFLSCAAEQTVYLWHKDLPGEVKAIITCTHRNNTCGHSLINADPILCYDVGYQVTDVAWAPYSSTVFALVTGDGAIAVFDIQLNKYRHICRQKVITSGEGGLNKIAFNTQEPIVVVGDTTGNIHSLKLSPNLRKKTKEILRAIQNNNPREVR